MLSASAYIIACSAKNRLRVRLRRLREPRYLIGAIVGAAYIYFSFFARFRAQRTTARRRARATPASPAVMAALTASGPQAVGLALLVLTALSWLLPFDSGLLDFSEAEIQFLFPAPVPRRSLLVHRLLRSQLGMLFGAVVFGLVTPSLSGYSRLRFGVGMWLLLCTAKIYFTGVTLARTRWSATDLRARRLARLPIAVMTAALIIVSAALYTAFAGLPIAGPVDFFNRLRDVQRLVPARIVLWPFTALAQPLFAESPVRFVEALASALVVLAGVAAWVVRSDEAFDEAALSTARAREQSPKGARTRYRARASVWTLAPSGRPEIAFAWKAAMQTFRIVDVRTLARIVAILFALSIAAVSVGQRNGIVGALAMFAMTASVFAMLLAPQAIRIDLRQDLQHLELLKMWPLRPADVVRGELLWPGALITVMAWTAIAFATVLSGALFNFTSLAARAVVGVAAALLAPGIAFAQLTIQNGLALLFPAWVALGNQRARGLDAMGQRIITLGGTWLVLLAMAVPGAVAGSVVWFAFRLLVGPAAIIPAAAVCSIVLLVEALAATELLGPAFERIDLLAVERAE